MEDNRGMVVEGSFDFEGPDNAIRWFLAAWDGRYKYMQDCHKYIPGGSRGLDLSSFRFLYDLEDDPRERINLVEERPDILSRMEKLIADWERRIKPLPLPPPAEDEIDDYPPGLVEQLRALGYMK